MSFSTLTQVVHLSLMDFQSPPKLVWDLSWAVISGLFDGPKGQTDPISVGNLLRSVSPWIAKRALAAKVLELSAGKGEKLSMYAFMYMICI